MKNNRKRGERSSQSDPLNADGFNSPVERILSKLPDAKRSGDGWSARCPAHDDTRASLSINEGSDGKALVKCHAGCSIEAICHSVDLRVADLMANSPVDIDRNRQNPKEPSKTSTKEKPSQTFKTVEAAIEAWERSHGPRAAEWPYHTPDGELIGVILRWDLIDGKKTIMPVSKWGDCWLLKGMPSPRPLYRISELKGATRVYITEGEKAADVVRSLGLKGTTSSHGSQAANQSDWSQFAGVECCILPDNDPSGLDYVNVVTEILLKLDPPAIVKIVNLPGLPPKGDIYDWSEMRDGADSETLRKELEALADEAKPVESLSPEPINQRFLPFPTHALPEPISTYIKICSKAIRCDESYLALPILSVLASSIGNSRKIRLKRGWTEPAIVWTGIVGDSGTMKSPALELALEPVRELQRKSFELHDTLMEKYQTELARYERDLNIWKRSKKEGDDPPVKPLEPVLARFWTDDTTIEALAELLGIQLRGLLMIRDELAGWFGFDRYSDGKGTEVSRWLEMHGGRSIMIDRKTGMPRRIYIPRASVSVTGGIQPEILKEKLVARYRQNGLAARLLLAWPPSQPKKWTEDEISDLNRQVFAEIVEKLHHLEMRRNAEGKFEPVVVDLTPGGKQEWVKFYNEHGEQQAALSGDLSAAWSKLEGYAARFALIIHFCRFVANDSTIESPDFVDEMSIRAGICLSRWFGNEAKRIYSMLDEDEETRDERKLVEQIRKRGGSITVRELMRSSHQWNTRKAEEVESVLNRLAKSGQGYWKSVSRPGEPGRPSHHFYLNNVDTIDQDTTKD